MVLYHKDKLNKFKDQTHHFHIFETIYAENGKKHATTSVFFNKFFFSDCDMNHTLRYKDRGDRNAVLKHHMVSKMYLFYAIAQIAYSIIHFNVGHIMSVKVDEKEYDFIILWVKLF